MGAHLERFVEPDDVGVSEYCHDTCLAVQVSSLILIFHLASVNDFYSDLQRHSHTSYHIISSHVHMASRHFVPNHFCT